MKCTFIFLFFVIMTGCTKQIPALEGQPRIPINKQAPITTKPLTTANQF